MEFCLMNVEKIFLNTLKTGEDRDKKNCSV